MSKLTTEHAWNLAQAVYFETRWRQTPPEPAIMLTPSELVRFFDLATGDVKPKLWLWKNFVDGRPEYWAFDNPYPIHLTDGDPQTLGEPCGYAVFKPSRNGRPDVLEDKVISAILRAK